LPVRACTLAEPERRGYQMNWSEWLEYEVFSNSLLAWASGLALVILAWIVLGFVHRFVCKRLKSLAERREFEPLRIAAYTVEKTRNWFLFLAAVAIGSQLWTFPPSAQALLNNILTIGLLLQIGLWVSGALDVALRIRRDRQLQKHPDAVAVMDVLGFVVRLVVWTVLILVILDNLGVEITALVAGLGIGGVAVALATQNILGDLFASLSIVLDKPFVVGDFLSIAEYSGSVEKVGIKTTRVRSLSGEQLIFSNNDLLNSRIRNFGRMFQRRVVFTIGVIYETPAEKLRLIPRIIREAVEAQEKIRFDRSHFQKYGDYALVFETVYYVLSPDYNYYMDVQQTVNLIIFERFAEEEIQFAYPAQTIHFADAAGAEQFSAKPVRPL
jgi:small-conductance mechanosensitive channel